MGVFVRHKIKQNWKSADGAGDSDLKRGIVISEIAKMINNNHNTLVDYLNLTGYKTEYNISDRDLIDKVVKALQESKKFAALISLEIMGKPYKIDKKFNGSGDTTTGGTSGGTDWASIIGSVGSIIGSVGSVVSAQQAAQAQAHAQAAANQAAQQAAQAQAYAAQQFAAQQIKNQANALGGHVGMTTQTKVIIGVSIGVALLATTGVIIYVYKNNH